MFLTTILLHIQYLLSSTAGIITIIQFLFYIFVCVRAWQATRLIQGKSAIISHFVSHGYKWYFFLFFALLVAAYIDIFVNNEATTFDYFDFPITLLGVFGLFGYTFKKQILSITTWKIYSVVIVVWDIIGLFIYPQQHLIVESSLLVKIIGFMFMIGLMMPYYIAIYLYGYKSKSIWNTKTHNQSLKH
jgi:hypothetical protein